MFLPVCHNPLRQHSTDTRQGIQCGSVAGVQKLAISETICRPMLVGSVLSWVVFAALVALAVRVSAWFCIPAVLVCIYAAMCTCLGISYTVLIRTLRGECEDPVR